MDKLQYLSMSCRACRIKSVQEFYWSRSFCLCFKQFASQCFTNFLLFFFKQLQFLRVEEVTYK